MDVIVIQTGIGEVTVSWNPIDSPAVAGYRVYLAGGDASQSSLNYLSLGKFTPNSSPPTGYEKVWEGPATTAVITGLTEGKNYSFLVCVTDSSGNEGDFSASVGTVPSTGIVGLSVTQTGIGQVTLFWNTVPGAAGYVIYQDVEEDFSTSPENRIGETTSTSWVVSGLTEGAIYYFRVTAVNVDGIESILSGAKSIVPSTEIIGLNLNQTGIGEVTVYWDAVTGAVKYFIYRSPDGSGFSKIGEVKNPSYVGSGLAEGQSYWFRVTAVGPGDGESVPSEAENIIPSTKIIGLNLNQTGIGRVTVSWNVVTGAVQYYVYRSLDGSGFAKIGEVKNPSYTDSGLAEGQSYWYRVTAVGPGNGESIPSEAKGIKLLLAPFNLQGIPVSGGRIDLTWEDTNPDKLGLRIERKTEAGGQYTQVGSAGALATGYQDIGTGLICGKAYYYRVYAYASEVFSDYSMEATATTNNCEPTAYLPAGCFNMGDVFGEGDSDERPVHSACVAAFRMDINEITNAQYRACVDSGKCTVPVKSFSNARFSYFGNPNYDKYPVIYVDWHQANAYCQWIGGRLPTEAEWEYAARGGLSGKRYPWGDNDPTCDLGAPNGAQYDSCSPGDTLAAGSFTPNGYGLYDLAGNAWEWVNDWYDGLYYSSSPTNDPAGPSSGINRVIRGGCWSSDPHHLRVAGRDLFGPTIRDNNLGFRCVR
ncbi:MAG: SUMF1/EgtB/PvdO family nonheme iron enzyme [bacterium]|nr:SUMF1/EgtB/PvdO family nonheme iron enzyme [bacterium]